MPKIFTYRFLTPINEYAKRLGLICVISFFAILPVKESKAQQPELGFGLGALNYAGDLNRGYDFSQIGIGGVAFYKMNFNEFVGTRFGITGGIVRGSDQNPIDAFAAVRKASFSVSIVEISALFEYNFIDFRNPHSLLKWSPYMFFGIAGMGIFGDVETAGNSRFQPSIPFGLGIRQYMGKRLTLNLELGLRKMFFDQLDGISDGDITNKNYQYGNKYDTDWYNFVGISISYILYDIPCPYDFY